MGVSGRTEGDRCPSLATKVMLVQRLGCHDLAAVFRLCCSTRCAFQFRYLNFKTLLLFFTRGKEDLFHGLVFVSPSSSFFNRVQIGFIGHRIFFVMLLTSNSCLCQGQFLEAQVTCFLLKSQCHLVWHPIQPLLRQSQFQSLFLFCSGFGLRPFRKGLVIFRLLPCFQLPSANGPSSIQETVHASD